MHVHYSHIFLLLCRETNNSVQVAFNFFPTFWWSEFSSSAGIEILLLSAIAKNLWTFNNKKITNSINSAKYNENLRQVPNLKLQRLVFAIFFLLDNSSLITVRELIGDAQRQPPHTDKLPSAEYLPTWHYLSEECP